MAAVCPKCGTSLEEVLQGDVPEEVQERLLDLHEADATKIDHVRRGDAQECRACGESTKGFHLYKSGSDFIKLCDDCATHVATLLAHLVADEQETRKAGEETEEVQEEAGAAPGEDVDEEAGQAQAEEDAEPAEQDAEPAGEDAEPAEEDAEPAEQDAEQAEEGAEQAEEDDEQAEEDDEQAEEDDEQAEARQEASEEEKEKVEEPSA